MSKGKNLNQKKIQNRVVDFQMMYLIEKIMYVIKLMVIE